MILVTGASGFLGAEVCKQLLAKGHTNIRAIKRTTSDLTYLKEVEHKIEWFEADLLDLPALEKAFEGVIQVYHCAAVISFVPEKWDWMHNVNANGTKHIVNLSLDAGVEKLVHVSSIAAIGRTKNQQLINEETDWDADSPFNSAYGKSKYAAELEVWRGIAEGLSAVIVNPSMIVGPINWEIGTGRFFTTIQQGFRFYTDGSNGIVDVEDVANAMLQLMSSDINAERYILSAENWHLKDLMIEIAKQLKKPLPNKKVTPLIAALAWRWEALKSKFTGKEPLLTKETLQNAMIHSKYDNRKIKDAIGFDFKPVNQTIERTARAFLASQ